MKRISKMTRAQLDRALLKLFNNQREVAPRVAFPSNLYDYTQALWAKTRRGRKALGK